MTSIMPTPPRVGQYERPTFPVQRGRGDNCREASTTAGQGGEAFVSSQLGRCVVCVGGGGITPLHPPNATTRLPTRMLANDTSGKAEGGEGKQGMLG